MVKEARRREVAGAFPKQPDSIRPRSASPGVLLPQSAGLDDNKVLLCATAQVATVDRDIGEGFGCSFKGPISFTTPTDGAGLAAVVNDVRTTGATNPWCALVCTARDVYDVIGSKA